MCWIAKPLLIAKTPPDIRLPVRSIAALDVRSILATLPYGSEIRVFGPAVQGRHQTRYRRLYSPHTSLHGGFVAESINGLTLLHILGEDADLATG